MTFIFLFLFSFWFCKRFIINSSGSVAASQTVGATTTTAAKNSDKGERKKTTQKTREENSVFTPPHTHTLINTQAGACHTRFNILDSLFTVFLVVVFQTEVRTSWLPLRFICEPLHLHFKTGRPTSIHKAELPLRSWVFVWQGNEQSSPMMSKSTSATELLK